MELGRKLPHLVALAIPTAYYFLPPRWAVVAMAAATAAYLTVDLLRLRLNPFKSIFIILFGSFARQREFTSLTGGSYLMLAALACMVVFGGNRGVFIAAMGFLILGDTAAALVGLAVGRVRLFRKKTLEGTLAGLGACLLVAWVVSRLPGPGLDLPFRIGILGAVAASVVEVLPFDINDNVVVPVFSGAVMMVALQVLR